MKCLDVAFLFITVVKSRGLQFTLDICDQLRVQRSKNSVVFFLKFFYSIFVIVYSSLNLCKEIIKQHWYNGSLCMNVCIDLTSALSFVCDARTIRMTKRSTFFVCS